MKLSITKEFKNNYPNTIHLYIDDISKKIFESLGEGIIEYGNFELITKKYTKKWKSAKGRLEYKMLEDGEPKLGIKIKFLASYPFADPEDCYVKAEVEMSANKGKDLDEKIFDILEEKFYSFKEKDKKNEN